MEDGGCRRRGERGPADLGHTTDGKLTVRAAIFSSPPAFQGGGGGLVSTADDYHAYFRMLLNQGLHGTERILSRAAVELMTTNRLTPAQQAARDTLARDNVHISFGQGQHGSWGFGMAVRTYRGDYASAAASRGPCECACPSQAASGSTRTGPPT
ncbi:serine hydrolase [Catellatospora tritici]|uniref:serine hydrolase n=1 Tax=Catellatospora tritici TaxID=2851566 RepID=UPI0020C530F7|nr:serine hydrolase [Catellatospora tritici]